MDTPIDANIRALPEDARPVAESLRAAILRAAPDATEAIKYKMPAFLDGGVAFVYFALWKKHAALYPVYPDAGDLEPLIAPYRDKKDTLHFALNKPIPYALVEKVAGFKLAQKRAAKSGA